MAVPHTLGLQIRIEAYIVSSFIVSAWIYPVVCHWIWGGGFMSSLKPFNEKVGILKRTLTCRGAGCLVGCTQVSLDVCTPVRRRESWSGECRKPCLD